MLNKDEILGRTNNGLDVFKHYIPGGWHIGRNFLNPLYEDRKASCNIWFDRRGGCYRMKDFGNDAYSGDCFDIVGKLKNLNCGNPKDFIEILQAVNRDLHLGLSDDYGDTPLVVSMSPRPVRESKSNPAPQPENLKKAKPYSISGQSFSVMELSFWGQYGITPEILKMHKILSLKEFKSENSEGKPFAFHSTDDEPIFGYQGKKHIKIYRPKSEIRFLYGGLLSDNYCFGLEQLPSKGDTLFITGGEKDVMSLVARGFHAICFNLETSNIPWHIIKKLSYRFKHIILLYDTDRTGLELPLPLAGTKQEKDILDYFKMGNTRENFISLFIEFLDILYSETMAILKSCEIDFGNPPLKSEMLISINGVPLGTQGNLFGITGGEGTGKSNFVGALIAGVICENSVQDIDTLGTKIQPNTAKKAILLYDTEQSETQLYKNISAVLKRGRLENMPPEVLELAHIFGK